MGQMRMSSAARRALTERFEGRRLVAYRDCVGVLTIGYGHTSRAGAPTVTPGMKITDAQADDILSRDLGTFERGVAAAVAGAKGGVSQREFDALVDLAFNIGLGAFKSSSLLRAYRAGDKATAARKFLDWNKAGGRVVAGLTTRRTRERAWFLTPDTPSYTVAPEQEVVIAKAAASGETARKSAPAAAPPYPIEIARKLNHPDPLLTRFATWLGGLFT